MKVTEGNYFEFEESIGSIIGFDLRVVYLQEIDNSDRMVTVYRKNIKPIDITKELLIKIGFITSKVNLNFLSIRLNDEFVLVYFMGKFQLVYNEDTQISITFMYIHQVQNFIDAYVN